MANSPADPMEKGRRLESLHALWMLFTAAAEGGDEKELARLAAAQLPSVLECSLSAMVLRAESGEGWTPVVKMEGGSSLEAEFPNVDWGSLFAEAVREGVLRIPPGGTPTVVVIPPGLRSLSLVAVPMITLHSQIGLLLVGRKDSAGFSADETFVVHTLAERLAVGVENLRLHERQRRHTEDLEGLVEERTRELRLSRERHRALLEINNTIVSNLDRGALLEAIGRILRQAVEYDRASLLVYDPERETVQVYALTGASPKKATVSTESEFPYRDSMLSHLFQQRRALVRHDLRDGDLVPPEDRLLGEGIRSYVAVPLISKGRPLGSLNVGSKDPGRYSEEDAAFLSDVGAQVALAVENMLAYEEIAKLKAQLERENVYLHEEIEVERGFEELVGASPAFKKVLKAVETVASTDATVLLVSETGTGKELVARAVHRLSPWKDKPLVKVNCAALPAGLVESELFGHEKGAFTGALSRKIGRFEMADGGTIFLDEIGDLPLELQAKLLRVLQEGEFERVGGTETISVRVRVIAATNRDLEKEVAEGKFRPDLYYRLSVFPIPIPPLRERRDDIPRLARHFLMKYGSKFGKGVSISESAMSTLTAYSWPGNVRELENIIERAMILTQGPLLQLGEWPPRSHTGSSRAGGLPTLRELEREHIEKALAFTGGRIGGERGAAKLLGLKPTTLQAKMKKLGVERKAGSERIS